MTALDELEASGADPATVSRRAARWLDGPGAERFGEEFADRVRQWLDGEPSADEWRQLATVAVRSLIGLPSALPSRIRTEKLLRVAERASFHAFQQDGTDRVVLREYLRELRLVSADGGATAAGRVALALTGRDLVRWLLALEMTLASGPWDRVRLAESKARTFVELGSESSPSEGPASVPGSAVARLRAFGLLSSYRDDDRDEDRWELYDEGRVLLSELLDAESPFRSLARATLADDLSATIAGVTGQAIISDYARREVTQHAREVSHEIRNALSPAALAIAKIRSHLEGTNEGATLDVYVRKIEHAINRSLDFADSSTLLAHLSGARVEEFRCHDAVMSAISAIDSGARIQLPGREVVIRGDRQRFELALVNILRNAEQARQESDVRVQIEIRAVDTVAELTIDDAGPGVPESERARIFDIGIHLNPDGTGHGLAIARQVIEREFRGVINCSEASIGGARFTLRIPRVGG